VREVQQLFIDLANLVDFQQEQINNIESHITSAKAHVDKGLDHLDSASSYQDKARKRQCCIFILIVCVLGVVLGPTLGTQLGK